MLKLKKEVEDILDSRAEECKLFDFYYDISFHTLADRAVIDLNCENSFGSYMTYDLLKKLALLFETADISIADEQYSGGCDTCDFGMGYSIKITIENAVL